MRIWLCECNLVYFCNLRHFFELLALGFVKVCHTLKRFQVITTVQTANVQLSSGACTWSRARSCLTAFFVDIPQLDMLRSKTHYEMLLSPWVWISHVTGVCVSVFKCALIVERMSPVYPVKWNCIETGDRVSHERRSDTDRLQQRAALPPSDAAPLTLLSSAEAT